MICKDRSNLFVLVGCNSNKLGISEGDVGNHPVTTTDTYNMDLWLVFVKRIQHNLRQKEMWSNISKTDWVN